MNLRFPVITRQLPPLLRFGLGLLTALPLLAQISIQTSALPAATVGKSYSVTLAVSGGISPYTWSATGNIPSGLSILSFGAITGTPTVVGSYVFTLIVTDSHQATALRTLTLSVSPGSLSITTASPLPAAVSGQGYSTSLAATGGTPPYQWAAGAGLPGGLTINPQTGALAGTPSAAGVFTFPIQVTDATPATATASFSLTVHAAPIAITTVPPLFAGTVGSPYSQSFLAAGGTQPYTWSISSGNTGGLTLDASTGALHGTPQTSGTFSFVVQVADSAGTAASGSFAVVVSAPVLTIAVASTLPPGIVGAVYSQQLPVVATGGTPPYQWSLTSGGAPAPGLTFDPNVLTVSGTPTAPGTFTFTVQVTDSNSQTATRSLTITITPSPLTITTNGQLPAGSLNFQYTATLAALGGSAPYTWSAVGLPAGLSINSSTGAITGVPTAAGNFPVAITVTDSALASIADRFTLTINLPATPAVSVSGLPTTAAPAQQYSVQVALASTFPAPITGQAILTFSPDNGPTDQTVQFASGGTTANFSIPVGTTAAVSNVPLAIQTGTTSGTISISLRLQAGGIDITPLPVPAMSTQIAAAAPVITNIQTKRSTGSISLIVSGYSTAREVAQATFTFTAASGQTLQSSASSILVSLGSLFGAWFQNPSNSPYGTQFVLTQPFSVQGDSSAVIPQSVTLTNRVGSITYTIQ
jgi:large repetitive protein